MGIGLRGVSLLVLMISPDSVANEEWLWILRANLVQALENLNWVPKITNKFYPNGNYEWSLDWEAGQE